MNNCCKSCVDFYTERLAEIGTGISGFEWNGVISLIADNGILDADNVLSYDDAEKIKRLESVANNIGNDRKEIE